MVAPRVFATVTVPLAVPVPQRVPPLTATADDADVVPVMIRYPAVTVIGQTMLLWVPEMVMDAPVEFCEIPVTFAPMVEEIAMVLNAAFHAPGTIVGFAVSFEIVPTWLTVPVEMVIDAPSKSLKSDMFPVPVIPPENTPVDDRPTCNVRLCDERVIAPL